MVRDKARLVVFADDFAVPMKWGCSVIIIPEIVLILNRAISIVNLYNGIIFTRNLVLLREYNTNYIKYCFQSQNSLYLPSSTSI